MAGRYIPVSFHASKLACSNREQAMRNDEPRAAISGTPSRTAEAAR